MSSSINHLTTAEKLFFGKGDLDKKRTDRLVEEALAGCDDGELYLQFIASESFGFDDGRLKTAD